MEAIRWHSLLAKIQINDVKRKKPAFRQENWLIQSFTPSDTPLAGVFIA